MGLYKRLHEMDIILIEDDEWLRGSLALFFMTRGCRVRAFGSADEARQAVERKPPGMVICDHWLPGTDGLTFLKWIGGRSPETVRILITGHPAAELFDEVKRAGIDDFVLKPFTAAELEASLERSIGGRGEEVLGGTGAP